MGNKADNEGVEKIKEWRCEVCTETYWDKDSVIHCLRRCWFSASMDMETAEMQLNSLGVGVDEKG